MRNGTPKENLEPLINSIADVFDPRIVLRSRWTLGLPPFEQPNLCQNCRQVYASHGPWPELNCPKVGN